MVGRGFIRWKPRQTQTLRFSQPNLYFSVTRVHNHLRRVTYSSRVGSLASVYLAAVLQYLTSEILQVATSAAGPARHIFPKHLQFAVRNDEELGRLFGPVIISRRLLYSGRWCSGGLPAE
ncbi:histone H2A type 1-F-like [Pelodytes ibericus]